MNPADYRAAFVPEALPPPPDLSVLVTYSEPALPAPRLLDALSKRTHVRLECAPEVRDEILLLHVRQVPLGTVMTRIAEVAGARWRRTDRAWILERSAEMTNAQREREVRNRAAWIAPQHKRMLIPLQKPWDDAVLRAAVPGREKRTWGTATDEETDVLDPAWRAFLRCLSDIRPEDIARILAGGRAVFATKPTPRQQPLGKGAQEALAKLCDEQIVFGTALRRAGMKDLFEDGHPRISARHSLWERLSPYSPNPARAVFVIERKWDSSYEAELTLLDENHRAVVEVASFMRDLPFVQPHEEDKPQKNSPVVPLSPRSRILSSIKHQNGILRASSEARHLLISPEQYEPLGMAVSDGYLALARTKNRNLIAALPDRLVHEMFPNDRDSPLTLADVRTWSLSGTRMRIVDREGWFIVAPPDPWEARQERADRTVLGKIARRIAQRGLATVEDIAEFTAHAGDKPMYHFGVNVLHSVSKAESNPDGRGNWTLLALYGALTGEQRRTLLVGKPILYGSLTARQRTYAEKAVYGPHYSFRGEGTQENIPAAIGDLAWEPTQCCPHGLPANLAIRARRKRQRIVYFFARGQKETDFPYWQTCPDDPPIGYSGPGPKKPAGGFDALRFQVRYRDCVFVQVDIAPWARIGSAYDEVLQPPTGPPVPLSKLPPDLQKSVKDEISTIRRMVELGERVRIKPE